MPPGVQLSLLNVTKNFSHQTLKQTGCDILAYPVIRTDFCSECFGIFCSVS